MFSDSKESPTRCPLKVAFFSNFLLKVGILSTIPDQESGSVYFIISTKHILHILVVNSTISSGAGIKSLLWSNTQLQFSFLVTAFQVSEEKHQLPY